MPAGRLSLAACPHLPDAGGIMTLKEKETMTIIEALRDAENYDIRVTHGNRWLVWGGEWVVYERKPYQKKTRTVIVTASEKVAVEYLVEED